jgi:hypothetical protein
VATVDWRVFELQHAALTEWRQRRGWPETLHFADAREEDIPKYTSLLAEVQRRRAGLMFIGYALPARKGKREVLLSLFVQIVIDALHRLDDLSCLNEPKAITVVKESEEGFDQLLLPELRQTLSEQIAREFEDRVYFRDVIPRPKGREVMLEVADVIASGMRRRLTSAGLRGKDVIAEAVMNVTGFEDAGEVGALYRTFMP